MKELENGTTWENVWELSRSRFHMNKLSTFAYRGSDERTNLEK